MPRFLALQRRPAGVRGASGSRTHDFQLMRLASYQLLYRAKVFEADVVRYAGNNHPRKSRHTISPPPRYAEPPWRMLAACGPLGTTPSLPGHLNSNTQIGLRVSGAGADWSSAPCTNANIAAIAALYAAC